ncbi:MAG: hypothetical protein IPO41_00470 [Acidobacteria bacterium]|nr:hypothetical protein [Acidobacteriota bacterium]MBP7474260.1 hypothetical protein [Pyrinomonadaceae bacterium]
MDFGQLRNDFEVRYRFLSPEEGGRKSGPPMQGFRSDWKYAQPTIEELESKQIWAIYPVFLDSDGELLPENTVANVEGTARMFILNDDLRRTEHRHRIRVGTQGYFVEGPFPIALATVTRVVELANI